MHMHRKTDEPDHMETSPKHLRTGVNMAMVSQDALIKILIAKGIVTEHEYFEALVVAAQAELTRYEKELNMPAGTFL